MRKYWVITLVLKNVNVLQRKNLFCFVSCNGNWLSCSFSSFWWGCFTLFAPFDFTANIFSTIITSIALVKWISSYWGFSYFFVKSNWWREYLDKQIIQNINQFVNECKSNYLFFSIGILNSCFTNLNQRFFYSFL